MSYEKNSNLNLMENCKMNDSMCEGNIITWSEFWIYKFPRQIHTCMHYAFIMQKYCRYKTKQLCVELNWISFKNLYWFWHWMG